jgi:type 1 glutamine amidotransferase
MELVMRKALIVWGGWSGHDPEECAAIYRRWLHEDGYSVRMETDLAVFGEPEIKDLSLIVPIYTMSKIERELAQNLASAVEGGVGLAGHHGGMSDAFRDSVDYQFVVGGQWVAHPGDVIDYTVDVTRPDDPIMKGLPASFPYTSEQYYMHMDPSVEVLATTTFSGEHAAWTKGVVMPVVWKRLYGAGRVFHSTLGHKASEFEVPEMATILRRGINWAARPEA